MKFKNQGILEFSEFLSCFFSFLTEFYPILLVFSLTNKTKAKEFRNKGILHRLFTELLLSCLLLIVYSLRYFSSTMKSNLRYRKDSLFDCRISFYIVRIYKML